MSEQIKKMLNGENMEILVSVSKSLKDSPENTALLNTSRALAYLWNQEYISLSTNLEDIELGIISLYNSLRHPTIPFKEKKLIELYNIQVFTGIFDSSKVSYKNFNNVNHEVEKIIRSSYTLGASENIRDILPGITSNRYGEFFLNINSRLADMINSRVISYYSALLNFSDIDMNLELPNFNNLKMIDVVQTISGISNDRYYENWDERRKKFILFLEQLKLRTINYE